MGEAIQAGVLVTTGALQRKAKRLQLSNGKFHRDGWPFHRVQGADGRLGGASG